MKIFVINLKDSTHRRLKMEGQLTALNLEYEFIEAVDGRILSDEEIAKLARKTNYAFLPGEIGCALSHQKIYKKMIDEHIEQALILEDDVILEKRLEQILAKIQLPKHQPNVVLLSRVNKYYKKETCKIFDAFTLNKTQHATTAHSYIINNKGAQSLLEALFPVWMVADKWSFFEDLSLLNVHSVVPHPVSLSSESNVSTINSIKGNDDINRKKKEIWNYIMQQRSFKAKIKHKYRRAIVPLFNTIINQGKG